VTKMARLGMLPPVLVRRCQGLSALALLLAGCSGSGTETGNPSFTGSLGYTGHSSAPDDYGIGTPARVAQIDAAWFVLGRVKTSACDTDVDFEVAPLGLGDHAAGSHVSTSFTADAGKFCGLRLPFSDVAEDATTSGAPAALTGHALLLSGELADGTAFTIVSDAAPIVELAALDGGFELTNESAGLLLAFDFAVWLKDLDFAAAKRTSAGAIDISSAANSELLAAFDAQLTRGVTLYRDRDQDAVLDENPEVLATAP
jgi:hypothetical protein